jgi:spore coat protein U-like protein
MCITIHVATILHNAAMLKSGAAITRGRALTVLCLALAWSAQAPAAVSFSCAVSASGINFGVYNPLNAAGDGATGSWTVTCTATGSGSATVAGTLTLSTGQSGQYATRYMSSGSNQLDYNVYLLPSDQQIIGNGTGNTYAPSAAGTVTAGQVYQVAGTFYGFIPGLQEVAPGTYTDTLFITVSY